MKGRVATFVLVTIAVAAALISWEPPPGVFVPAPNVLASTWYGPVLLMLIPLALAWVSAGAQTQKATIRGIVWTLIVAFLCVCAIVMERRAASPFPFDEKTLAMRLKNAVIIGNKRRGHSQRAELCVAVASTRSTAASSTEIGYPADLLVPKLPCIGKQRERVFST